MSDNYDGFVNCPHCHYRQEGPLPSANSKLHVFECGSCHGVFVVQDVVEHNYVIDVSPPFAVGHKFRRPDGEAAYTAKDVYLTVCQGWWVYGVRKGGYTHMPCKETVSV